MNYISPVSHPESSLSGSTIESMIDRTKVLGLKYFASTDHGYLTSILKGYAYAKKKDIKFIAGIELFFKDPNCDIIKGTPSENIKYFKLVVHAKDQVAYQQIVKMSSDRDRSQALIGDNYYSLFVWKDIETLAKYNITVCTSNIEGMVSKHLLVDRADLGLKYYEKLRNLVGAENFFPTIIPYKQDQYWNAAIKAVIGDKEVVIPINSKIEFEELDKNKKGEDKWKPYKKSKAKDLIKYKDKAKKLTAVYIENIKYNVKKDLQNIKTIKLINDFQPLPGGDIQTKANKFIIALAAKFDDIHKLLINNYAYYASEGDKVVQNMKLGEEKRVYQSQFMASYDDVKGYMIEELGMKIPEVQRIAENSHKWAKLFDNFELKYDYKLPTPEGEPQKLLIDQIKKVGRMKWDDPRYVTQFREEFELLTQNGVIDLIPYFLPIIDIYDYYDNNGFLTGPARGCLTKETLVYTDKGIKSLDKVDVGDYVVSHTGLSKRVLNKMEYDVHNEPLLMIKSQYSYQSNTMTKDHKILAIRRNRIDNHPKSKVWENWNIGQLEWYAAEQLKIGDLVFTPKPVNRKIKDIDVFDLAPFFKDNIIKNNSIEIKKPIYNGLSARSIARESGLVKSTVLKLKHRKKVKLHTCRLINTALKKYNISLKKWVELDNTNSITIKRFLKVDKEFCNFIGRWIGDGWLTKKNNGFGICFNSDEIEDEKYYTSFLTKIGWNLYKYKSNNKKLIQYSIRNTGFHAFFRHIFPKYNYTSNTKCLSLFKHLPDHKLKWILEGLIGADGHVRCNKMSRFKKEYIDTTSKQMLHDIKEIMLFLNIPCSVSTREPYIRYQNNKEYLCKKSYKIGFIGITEKRSDYFNFITKKGYLSPITQIVECYADKVYDISVEDDHSYTTVDYTVHNSAGGFLISYLIGITHLDPIKYGLSTSRFLTLDRIQQGNIPDFDADLESRIPLVGSDGNSGYLFNKYGNKAAQISTRTLLRIKSAILDANRFVNNGKVEKEIAKLSKELPNTPQGIDDHDFIFGYEDNDGNHTPGLLEKDDALQEYATNRPEEWNIVKRALSLARQNSRHPCSFLISNEPIENTIPIFEVGGVRRVTQPEAKQCEEAGLIKYDFLVVSALKDINLCINYINEKNKTANMKTGYFIHNGEKTYIWDLPEDPAVFKMLSDGHTESVFQLNSAGATPTVMKVKPKSIIDLSTITALERPGPKDFRDPDTGRNMVEEYIERKHGRSVGEIEILNKMLPETYGIIAYQEQVTKLAKELAGMGVIDAENVRIAVGKKKKKLIDSLKPIFIEGASKKVDKETATKIWDMMETFARYGFNFSHAVAYSIISYSCSYLKHYYHLEWWASVISNADNKEINEVFYKYIKDIVLPPDINTSIERMSIDYSVGKIRNKLSMISGIGVKAADKIIKNRPYTNIQDFVDKKACGHAMTKKLIHVGVLDSFFKPTDVLDQKMDKFEKAVSIFEFNEKNKTYEEKIKDPACSAVIKTNYQKHLSQGPKEHEVDPLYVCIGRKTDFLIKKAIFPTMNLDLQTVLDKDSNTPLLKNGEKRLVANKFGRDTLVISGESLQKIDNIDVNDNAYFCVPGYVVSAEIFDYSKNTRKALKMIIDSSGYISEKVLWPDYNTGELKYPESLKKGAIAYFFYSKKVGKPYTNIFDVIVEEKSILNK